MLRSYFNKKGPDGLAREGFRAYTGLMRPLSAFAAAFLLAVSAQAQSAKPGAASPGTATPHSSGDWGPDEAALRQKASALFLRLLDESRKGVTVDAAKVVYTKNPTFKVDLDHSVIGGSPAAAFSAGVGLNKTGDFSGSDLVYAGSALFEMTDQNEAAMFIAHEIGHLAYGHPQKLEDRKMAIVDRLYNEWEAANQEAIGRINADPAYKTSAQRTNAAVKLFFKEASPKLQAELNPIQQPMEDDADKYGRALAVQAGFPADATITSFQRAQDWLWALKLEMSDPNHAGTVADRALKNASWVADQRAAKERAETASRRAKAAAAGMSVP